MHLYKYTYFIYVCIYIYIQAKYTPTINRVCVLQFIYLLAIGSAPGDSTKIKGMVQFESK